MEDFLSELYFYSLQKEHSPHSHKYYMDWEVLEALENQIKATMGEDFWKRYENAALQCVEWGNLDAFRTGLRFGINLLFQLRP